VQLADSLKKKLGANSQARKMIRAGMVPINGVMAVRGSAISAREAQHLSSTYMSLVNSTRERAASIQAKNASLAEMGSRLRRQGLETEATRQIG
jgi:hypothetical protein